MVYTILSRRSVVRSGVVIALPETVRLIAERVRAAGGRALLIGGAVRDRLSGRKPTDCDLEVYGLPADTVRALAWEVGRPHEVGRAFGVLELRDGTRTIHLSLPRRESKVAPGHRGFAVNADPSLSPNEAARRRDFTINAIAEDPLTGEVLDPFHGRADLERKILRVVDPETFADDPLRVLRGAVFAAQFGLAVDPESAAIIRAAVPRLPELSRERVGEEWRKLLLRPENPSVGLKLLTDWGVFAVLHPEFAKLPETPQNPKWHPEGDVWTHTYMAVDEAARLVRDCSLLTTHYALPVMLATFCHDVGKATTTAQDARGHWHSRGHDAAGVAPTRFFLGQLAADRLTVGIVLRLVREHLQPLHFFNAAARGQPVTDGAIRKLARRLHPATIFLLTLVADADHRGRGPFYGEPGRTTPAPAADAGEQLRRRADVLGVLHGPPAPVLRGADLIGLGLPPGPEFGKVIRRAEELRDQQNLTREDLLARLRGATTAEAALARLERG